MDKVALYTAKKRKAFENPKNNGPLNFYAGNKNLDRNDNDLKCSEAGKRKRAL